MNFKEVYKNLTSQVVYVKDAADEHDLAVYQIPYLGANLSTPYDDYLVTSISRENNGTIVYILTDD